MRPPAAAATWPCGPSSFPSPFPTRRHSNCELGSRKPIKVQANPPALPRQFPVRPQLSELCLQAGKDLRIRGFGVSSQGIPPARIFLGLFSKCLRVLVSLKLLVGCE